MISKYLTILPVAAALLLAGCSKDEMAEQGTTLSDGAYPLEIGSVSITAEVSDEPSTRVSESSDGASSVFEDGDKIQVQIGSGTAGTYTYSSGSWAVADGDSPAYWLSAADGQTITAWYASNEADGTVDLSDQSAGLAYVLQASTTANYNTSASLSFSHQLAKVRVSLSGTAASGITSVEVYSSTSCSFDPTTPTLTGSEDQDYIPMMECTYDDVTCWEANVVPGETSSGAFIRLNGSTIVSLSGITSLEAGKVHVVDVAIYNEGEVLVSTADELSAAVATGGTITLTANIELSETLSVLASNVTINLNGYSIAVSEYNISVGSNASLKISGSGNIGCGVNVNEGGELTISGGTFIGQVLSEADGIIKISGGAFYMVDCIIGTVVISGGTFNYPVNCVSGTIEISGGTFSDSITNIGGTVEISGGTFYTYDPSSYVPAGYTVTVNADGYYVVEPE